MSKKRAVSLLMCVTLLFMLIPAGTVFAADHVFSVAKDTFSKGDIISVSFTADPNTRYRVRIYPWEPGFNVNGSNSGTYVAERVVTTNASGTASTSFDTSGLEARDWTFALINYSTWTTSAYFKFTLINPSISLNKTTYLVGETINVTWKDIAFGWAAIYPAGYTDQYNYSDYINVGAASFPSGQSSRYKDGLGWPLPAGDYVAVLYSGSGYSKVMEVPFEIVETLTKTISLNKTEYWQGESMQMTFENIEANDYIIIWPASGSYYTAADRKVYKKFSSPVTSFTQVTSSLAPGKYFVGLFDHAGNWTLISKIGFDVAEGPPLSADGFYVDATNGNDSNTGTSSSQAFKTLAKAIQTADASDLTDKRIFIIGSVSVGSITPHTNMITICGTGGSTLTFTGTVSLNGPTTFEYITIGSNSTINTLGSKLVFGKGVSMALSGGPTMHAGTDNSSGGREDVTLMSGTFSTLFLGAFYNLDEQHETAGANVVIDGATLNRFILGADHYSGCKKGVDFTGNVNITINSGTLLSPSEFRFQTYYLSPVFKAAFQIVYNNGMAETFELKENPSAPNGVWIMKGEKRDGSSLSVTEQEGTFIVNGPLTAVATDVKDTTKKFVSVNGELVVPSGTYTVQYGNPEDFGIVYTNSGEKITVYQDTVLDLAVENHLEIDGKAFVGWVTEDGTPAVSGATFSAGTVLTAEYVEYSKADGGDFYITGVQMRTSGVQALRFIVEKTSKITDALPGGAVEYGTIVLPSIILNSNTWTQLVYDGEYTYNSKSYTPAVAKCENIFATLADRIQYTVCITNITEDKYTRMYTVRGYIKYKDKNGFDRIIYTDEYYTNLHAVAKVTLATKSDELPSDAKRILEGVVSSVKANTIAKYDTAKTNVVGTSADPNRWIYKLADSNIMVREVNINTGKGGDPIDIVHITDLHFNYMNANDLKAQNATLMSTYKNRTWLANGASARVARKVLDFAAFADQLVITGDTLDYLSDGAVEMMYKEIWGLYPDALIASGNHDYVQQMQGTVGEIYTIEERYAMMQSVWKHDVTYTSKVLGDKVMVIQLDNGQQKFLDNQVALLTADLATARQKGYTVLLFMHIPLYTNNPAESSVNALRADGQGWATSRDFYTNQNNDFVGSPSMDPNSATAKVYNLITNNGDIIRGVFNGHAHADVYTEIAAKTAGGSSIMIPQYTLTGSIYGDGHVLKIRVN